MNTHAGKPGKLYTSDWHTTFTEQMKGQHASVKRTHNVVVQSSGTAGANISHFPNYHISHCHELCDADRSRSASSKDDSTWVLQQLMGMTPLSTKVCPRMMGLQELSSTLVSQCAKLLKTDNRPVHKPTVLCPVVRRVNTTNNSHLNNYDGHSDLKEGQMQPWVADQFKTNLMLSIMAHFHLSSYVREESASYAFVPEHVQTMVMLAFADVIEKNVTQSEMLEQALG